MQKLILLPGRMNAGKTSSLLYYAGKLGLTKVDCLYNTRDSNRDMAKLTNSYVYPGNVPESKTGYALDEIHLYQVYNATDKLLCFVNRALQLGLTVVATGIFYDCYNNFIPFTIWKRLYNLLSDNWGDFFPYDIKVEFLGSPTPCAICGEKEKVFYSLNNGETKENPVGDNYINICHACKDKTNDNT